MRGRVDLPLAPLLGAQSKVNRNIRYSRMILSGFEEVAKPCPSTFSLVARDPNNGDLGIIVESKFPVVGAMLPWASAGVGAVATQALANTSVGPGSLQLITKGKSAPEMLKLLLQRDGGAGDDEMLAA